MKPCKLKEARKLLLAHNCTLSRPGNHEVWIRDDGMTFSLPTGQRKVSAGIMRKLTYFVNGSGNYGRR